MTKTKQIKLQNRVTPSYKQQNWPQRDLWVCVRPGLWRRPTGSPSYQSCRSKSGCCHRNCRNSQWETNSVISCMGAEISWVHLFSIFSFLVCLQLTLIFHAFWCYIAEWPFLTQCAGGCDNSLTYQHPEPRIHGRCMSSAGSLGSRSTALEICHCHKTAGSSHQLTKQGDTRQKAGISSWHFMDDSHSGCWRLNALTK